MGGVKHRWELLLTDLIMEAYLQRACTNRFSLGLRFIFWCPTMSKMADVSVLSLRSTDFSASSAVRIGAAMDANTRNTVDVNKQCTIKTLTVVRIRIRK